MLHEPVAGFFLIIKNIVSAFKLHSLKSFIVKLFSSSFPPLALTLMRLFFARINFWKKILKTFFSWIWTSVHFDFWRTFFNKRWHDCLKNITIFIHLSRNGYIYLSFLSPFCCTLKYMPYLVILYAAITLIPIKCW